jgi:hypothetical protein
VLQAGSARTGAIHGGSYVGGEPQGLSSRSRIGAAAGFEHLVLDFSVSDWAELDEQMARFAESVRPQFASRCSSWRSLGRGAHPGRDTTKYK